MKKTISAFLLAFICALSSHGQGLQQERTILETFVSDWKQYHNSKDLGSLRGLYDTQVFFYGDRVPADRCIQDKAKYLRGEHDFVMSVKSDLHFNTYKDGVVKCSFIKSIYFRHKLRESPGYLVLKKYGKKYKIIAESDRYADQNLAVKPDWGKEVALDQFLADTLVTDRSSGGTDQTWTYFLLGGLLVLVCGGVYFYLRARRNSNPSPQTTTK